MKEKNPSSFAQGCSQACSPLGGILDAVVLAGGQSTRMGRNKAWLPVGHVPLISHQIECLRWLHPRQIYISAGPGQDYGQWQCPVLTDIFPGEGPLAGIYTSLRTSDADLLLVLAVDMPFMTPQFFSHLVYQCSRHHGTVPRLQDRLEPLAAIYPKECWRVAEILLEDGDGSATRFARLCASTGLVSFHDCSEKEAIRFTNWNRPSDVEGKVP